MPVSESAMTLAESWSLLSLLSGVHALVDEVWGFSVLRDLQSEFKETYVIYNLNSKVNWKDESSVEWPSYVCSNGNVLHIPAWEVATGKWTAKDVQVRKLVGVESVGLQPGHRETSAEATHAASSVPNSSDDFPPPDTDVFIVEDEFVEKTCSTIFEGWRSKMTVKHLRCSMCRSLVKLTVCWSRLMSGTYNSKLKTSWSYWAIMIVMTRHLQFWRGLTQLTGRSKRNCVQRLTRSWRMPNVIFNT